MIVRILNQKADSDKFLDCRNTCLRKTKDGGFSLLFEYEKDKTDEIILNSGDEIYYMNDNGKTVHVDRRLFNKQKPINNLPSVITEQTY